VEIVLASGSPRRREILKKAGVTFRVIPSEATEELTESELADPSKAARTLADRKAGSVVQLLLAVPRPLNQPVAVIGADTMVVKDGQIFGKPRSLEEGTHMLQQLQGVTHQVITGVSVWMLGPDEEGHVSIARRAFSETSEVTFKPLSSQEIADYLACGESFDKAGAYAIQGEGAKLVAGYEGDYDNIVGLPVATLLHLVPALAE
jgi:septum formation protein